MGRFFKAALLLGVIIAVVSLAASCVPSASGEQDPNSTWYMLGFLVIIFGLFYFVMIRPQRKRMKDQQQMMPGLQKGDKVITAGGIFGTIDSVAEDSVVIKVESGVLLRIAKGSVAVLRDQQPQIK